MSTVRVLAFDPGAERLGWAVIEKRGDSPAYIDSGILRTPRRGKFQPYRLELEEITASRTNVLLDNHIPDYIASEIVPAVGGGNFVAATQSYLASVAIASVHTIAYDKGYRVEQIGATTVQAKIAIRGKGKKITKPQVRNGVVNLLPILKDRTEWVEEFDEPDAIAVALASLGFKNKSIKRG